MKNTKNSAETNRVNKSKDGYIYYPSNLTFKSKLTKSLKGQKTYLGSIIFKKELKTILFEETFGMVDYDWVLKIFKDRDSIEVTEALYTRIVDGENLSLNPEYRKKDFYYSLLSIEDYWDEYPKLSKLGFLKVHGSRARYYAVIGEMKKARFYFARSQKNIKNLLYYILTFVGFSFIKKHFNVFG